MTVALLGAQPLQLLQDAGPHGLLAPEVGGVDTFDGQEGEQGVGLVGQMLEQASAASRAGWYLDEHDR